MEEENLSMIHTIDEGIDFHQKLLNDRIKQLEGNNTSGREIIEKDKVAEENKIRDLQEKKEKLLEEPRFLFLIASESDKRVIIKLPTYIETEAEAKRYLTIIMKKLIKDNHVNLELGIYIGMIVRKSYYDDLDDQVNMSTFSRNENVYVVSESFVKKENDVIFPY